MVDIESLLSRLRGRTMTIPYDTFFSKTVADPDCQEAADEIERLTAELEKQKPIVDAARRLRINCSPSMNGNHIYSVNLGGPNNEALRDLNLAIYEFEEPLQKGPDDE